MKLLSISLLTSILFLPLSLRAEEGFSQEQITQFIDEMVSEHQFDGPELNTVLAAAEKKQKILDAISRPAEAMPWHKYRKIFIQESRINQGVKFWQENRELVDKVAEEYGVAPQILVAILGVETRYGRHRGSYRVIDALSTLAFAYPKRSAFFRKQLKQFLLMSREEKFDPLSLTGSYAGAMGLPQFIPSSFRAYAVDYDKSGRRDLWESNADVLGSIANYFKLHHWKSDGPVATRIEPNNMNVATTLAKKGYKPSLLSDEVLNTGINQQSLADQKGPFAIVALEQTNGDEFWLTHHNFYVITRYNHSPLYAMAVFQLSEAIRTIYRSAG